MGGEETAIVTGASSGIGSATARVLAAQGARIALVGRDEARLGALETELRAAGATAIALAADLGDDEAAAEVVRRTRERLGRVRVLINSAGLYRRGPLASSTLADFDAQWRINVRAPYALCQATLDDLRDGGRVVFVTSKAGVVGLPERATYGATKAAANLLVASLAAELAPLGVRVNGVAPGFIATPMNEALREDPGVVRFGESIPPAGRLGSATEVADAIAFLVSPAATYVHGQILGVDGGYPNTPAGPRPSA